MSFLYNVVSRDVLSCHVVLYNVFLIKSIPIMSIPAVFCWIAKHLSYVYFLKRENLIIKDTDILYTETCPTSKAESLYTLVIRVCVVVVLFSLLMFLLLVLHFGYQRIKSSSRHHSVYKAAADASLKFYATQLKIMKPFIRQHNLSGARSVLKSEKDCGWLG